MKQLKILLLVGLVYSIPLMSQTIDDGFYLLKMNQLKGASTIFNKIISQNPSDSKALYGMGEYYFKTGNNDSAAVYFEKSLIANKKNAYSNIGLAKVAFSKNDKTNAQLQIETAKKAGKKDASVFAEIAKVYLSINEKNETEALNYLTQGKAINPNCSDLYVVLGNIAYDKKNFNEAANHYESAIFFDSTQFEAYFAIAKIYESAQNSAQAIEFLSKLIAKTPECVLAYRELGELCFRMGKYSEAKKNYAKYIATAEYTSEEKERYAYTLFFSKEFDEAKKIISELSHSDPDNYIMLRLLSYTHFEQGEYYQGVNLFSRFFSKIPSNKILGMDYEFYANTLIKTKSDSMKFNVDSLAAIQFLKAYDIDTTKKYLLDEAGKSYTKAKKYDNAVKMYTLALQRKENPQASDYYKLGMANYWAGNAISAEADSVIKKEYLTKADTLFGTVYSLNPASHLGLLWRARANSLMDPQTTRGLAKPYYDKCMGIFTANPEKFRKDLIETYSYMGFYNLGKNELQTAKSYFQKVLDIDPSNAIALDVMKGFNNAK